ncbi:MAG: autotransporter-associated beta strand repeat-containing protein [Verrucomicrobiota bacterium]
MKPNHRLGLLSIFVSMSTPLAAQSTSTWNSTTNTNWSTATNWNPGIPASGDHIIISDTASTANPGLSLDDGSHSVGFITFGSTGTRTSAFNLQTTTANTLTIAGGVTANGNFTAGIGPRLRGKTVVSTNQTWQVGGEAGSHSLDRGLGVNEVSSGNLGALTLDANLSKSGTGQLTLGAVTVGGAGDINLNEGSLKLNAGGSLLLTVGGTGKIAANNTSTLIISKNSGTFNLTRPFQFNNTSALATGSGTNGLAAGPYDIASNMEWNGTHTITNNQNANAAGNVNYRFTGVMSGTGTLTKNGASQLILTGTSANTHTGQITVAAGELSLDKTGVTAVAGNILVTGGTLRINQANQIADTSAVTVTGGLIAYTANRPENISSLTISSAATSSLSGLTVTGATTISSNAIQELNSGQTFSTHSLTLSNNSAIRPVGNATGTDVSTINVGAGGLTLNTGRLIFGNVGNTTPIQLNLTGDIVSTGTSFFTATNYTGPRLINLQAATRFVAVNDGTLNIGTTVENGTLVKSGPGTLILSRPGSTADFSFLDGPTQITTQADAGNVALSGGTVLMDVGGATPAKLTAAGNFLTLGGSINITAANGSIAPGSLELVRYGGTLTGTPVINIPAELAGSRMAPVIDYGTGTNSSITLNSTALPLALVWHGATGGLWDVNTTANFNNGNEKFYQLDSVTFNDAGANATIVLDSIVFPDQVTFDHGGARPTYTLSGTGAISGPARVTKNGIGETIIATDNSHTGGTDILGGTLQVGNGGLVGNLGTGTVLVDSGTTLEFVRNGTAVIPNAITGSGAIRNNGPGIVALTANSAAFSGTVNVDAGTLQFGDGGADGSLGLVPIEIASGATFAVQRSGAPSIGNSLLGEGSVTIKGGSPIFINVNEHTGGVTVTDDGVLRVPGDWVLGGVPAALTPNAIRLNHGGLKNQDSATLTDSFRGVGITGEAYFTAGWTKTLAISGPITGTGNVFINYDSGTVIFSDATSNWNGILTLGASKPGFTGTTGGNLEISTISDGGLPGPLGTASADPANLVFNGGRLTYTGTSASTNRGFTLMGAGTVNVSVEALAIGGKATGPGALTKVGDGTLTLSGNNDFAGGVLVDDGVLDITHSNSLGAAAKILIIAGDAGGSRVPEVRLSGGISPTVADLDISGAGVANLTGALHNVSGDNTLTVTNDVTMRTGNGNTTLFSEAGTLTLTTPLVTANATGRALTLAGAGNGVINAVIANGTTVNLPVTKNGTGTWSLNGAHTYTGTTTVNEGVLSLAQAALSDTAAVAVGINGKLNLNFTGIDRVGSLTIDGLVKPDGVYDATTDPGFITGTGSIRVGAEASGYGNWASAYPFTAGSNDGPTHDPDGDGINNLLEYVLGGVPVGAGAGNTSILPSQSLTVSNLVLTFRRSDASESDVALKVQWSENMTTWNDFATVGPADALPKVDVTEDVPSAALDTVVVIIPRNTASGGKLFARVHAVK